MLKWVQSGLSAVAGFAEPEYGPDAIQPITKKNSKRFNKSLSSN